MLPVECVPGDASGLDCLSDERVGVREMKTFRMKMTGAMAVCLMGTAVLVLPGRSMAQAATIHGHVTNPAGMPLATGSVKLTTDKNPSSATAKYDYEFAIDANGNYKGTVDKPGNYIGVVFQGARHHIGCQFSFVCDGSLRRRPPTAEELDSAGKIALDALNGYVVAAVGTATHYHSWRLDPYWNDTLVKTAQIGDHIFYRWPGKAGQPSSLDDGRYAGEEVKAARSAPRQALA